MCEDSDPAPGAAASPSPPPLPEAVLQVRALIDAAPIPCIWGITGSYDSITKVDTATDRTGRFWVFHCADGTKLMTRSEVEAERVSKLAFPSGPKSNALVVQSPGETEYMLMQHGKK